MVPKYFSQNLFLVVIFSILSSCASDINQFDLIMADSKLSKTTIKGTIYNHLLISNNRPGDILHVYIEGDGLPWLNRHTISPDPTPNYPLALDLMSQDRNYALYLGRPCYFGLDLGECSTTLWTNGRYGKNVLDSMEAAIMTIIQTKNIEKIVMIGYSGGGVIASLLANRINKTQFYLTIAANLDIDSWTRHHGYSPLDKSINPISIASSMKTMGVHLIGENDQVVPQQISTRFIEKTEGKVHVFKNYDHLCCWTKDWNNRLVALKEIYIQ